MGIRYIVIAIGSPELQATEEDVETMKQYVEDNIDMGVTFTILNEKVSNKLTWMLIQGDNDATQD